MNQVPQKLRDQVVNLTFFSSSFPHTMIEENEHDFFFTIGPLIVGVFDPWTQAGIKLGMGIRLPAPGKVSKAFYRQFPFAVEVDSQTGDFEGWGVVDMYPFMQRAAEIEDVVFKTIRRFLKRIV